MSGSEARELVLDTSVAIKFHVPEEHRESALRLRSAVEKGHVGLHAPGTIYPEVFNALWWLHRRGELTREEAREGWDTISATPMLLYAPENLTAQAVEITFATGVIVYDALFLGLAEDLSTVMVTADDRMLKTIQNTSYEQLARHLTAVAAQL